MSNINLEHFISADYKILDNQKLREPQLHGYMKLYKHFQIEKKESHALVVLPTGVGKTGLIAMAPFGISQGRVLIIAPQLTIKDSLVNAISPNNHENFYRKFGVLEHTTDYPSVIEFDKNLPIDVLQSSNIVVINIQKLQERLENSPLKFLPKDFFDMIIIDEAHHSAAPSWIQTCTHFSSAKVLKVTATPLRPDKKEIKGDLVYRYKLSQAMAANYVKTLTNVVYIPEDLRLTIDKKEDTTYSIQEINDMNLKSEEWISRTIAFSKECSLQVVNKSIERLAEKREGTSVPHKIIAVASNIDHAEEIASYYVNANLRTVVLHSNLDNSVREARKLDIENHRVDVVVNVSLLGEGYDHKYLSIGAIFRAYRNLLPYAQFVGRVLRNIPYEETSKASDNIAEIVAHRHLYLEKLWETYKVEIQESEIIKSLSDLDLLQESESGERSPSDEESIVDIGTATDKGEGTTHIQAYMDTAILQKHKEEQNLREEDIKNLMTMLNIDRASAIKAIKVAKPDEERLLRPDLEYFSVRRDIDVQVREEIVPELLTGLKIDGQNLSLAECGLFEGKFIWIKKRAKTNGALLAMYLNDYLRTSIGRARKQWTTEDFKNAQTLLPEVRAFIESTLKDYLNIPDFEV